MPIPAAPYAFASLPRLWNQAEDVPMGDLARSLARGEGYLGFARNGWQETLGVHMTSGTPEQVIILPRPTYLPLYTAAATATAVLAMLAGFYALSVAAALLTAALFVLAGHKAGLERDYGPLPIGHGSSLPPHTEVDDSPPWWSLIFTLLADGTFFASLVFGTFYLWIAAPNWPAAAKPEPSLALAALVIAALLIAAAAARGSRQALANGKPIIGWAGAAMVALAVAIAGTVGMIAGVVPHPREHALGATAAALLAYIAFHAGVGLLFLVSNLLRYGAGRISSRRSLDLRLTRLWLDYSAFTGAIALGLVLALPTLAAMLQARP